MMGTGAFSTELDGSVAIDVVGPASAFLGVDANTGSEFVSQDSPVAIDLASNQNGGSGLPEKSNTVIAPVFTLSNGTDETLFVEIDNPLSNNNISTESGAAPAGVDVQFLAANEVPNATGIGIIGRNNGVQGSGNGLGAGFDDPGSNEFYFFPDGTGRTGLTQSNSKSQAGALEIGSGESYPVILQVAINDPGTSTDLDADIDIEAYDDQSKLTYDSLVNNVF